MLISLSLLLSLLIALFISERTYGVSDLISGFSLGIGVIFFVLFLNNVVTV